MLKTLFGRKYILMTLLVLAAMAVMARLGVWQLDRRQQRLARNADLVAKLNAAPLSLNEAAAAAQWPLPEDRSAVRNLRASATGEFDFAHQVLLVQQNFQDQPGGHLVTPLVLDGSDKALLVDRGWIPAADIESGRWQQYTGESGLQTVLGFVQPSQILFGRAAEKAAQEAAPQGPTSQWYRIDVAALQSQMPYQLLPVFLLQAPGPEGNTALPYRSEPDVDLSEGPHLGYALQWFAFALVAGGVYVGVVRSRERKALHPSRPEAMAEPSPAPGAHHA